MSEVRINENVSTANLAKTVEKSPAKESSKTQRQREELKARLEQQERIAKTGEKRALNASTAPVSSQLLKRMQKLQQRLGQNIS